VTRAAQKRTSGTGVVAACDTAGGAALQLPGGEFLDLLVAERARRLLDPGEVLVPFDPFP
jgi:hypothetical protein